MDTFTDVKQFQLQASYAADRTRALRELEQEIARGSINPPLLQIIRECSPIPHCFTDQCCYGHFIHDRVPDPENLVPIQRYTREVDRIEYRIAFLALCIEDLPTGHELQSGLNEIAWLNPTFIQFGSAGWFWDQMPNTYFIQLEPERMRDRDSGTVSFRKACTLEKIRPVFLDRLAGIIRKFRNLLPDA